VSGGATRSKVQTVVIRLAVMASTATATLALGPLADPSAPFERAFAAQHGSEVTATAKASPAQLAATTGLAGVSAAAGPFPETTVTATMLVPPPPGQSGVSLPAQQMTVVGRASPGGRDETVGRGGMVQPATFEDVKIGLDVVDGAAGQGQGQSPPFLRGGGN
jgi:putative ABC transport system permease protein